MQRILTRGMFWIGAAALVLALFSACRKEDYRTGHGMDEKASNPMLGRAIDHMDRDVFLLYSAGFNSLSGYLTQDIEDLIGGEYIPGSHIDDDILLVFSRFPVSPGNYYDLAAPTLTRIWRNGRGEVVCDTLSVPGITEETVATSKETMHKVLSFVKDLYPGSRYGMVLSSHGTGWLPEGYYSDPSAYDSEYDGGSVWSAPRSRRAADGSVPYVAPPFDPDGPAVKSVGQDLVERRSYEVSLKDFRDAIPMHLNYLILDACLMGGIEVAYELRDVVDTLGFSQTEILAEGFCYGSITRQLLAPGGEGPVGVCRDFFEQYDTRTDQSRSATVSLIDCQQLEPLADVCRTLFEKYRLQIQVLPPSTVQYYYRYNRHWFYDLEDILVQAGITASEKAQLEAALDQCVIYKAATPSFLSIEIRTYSGFSMFLPSHGSNFLRNYYKENLDWNTATALVQ